MLNVSKIRTAVLGIADTVGKKKDGSFVVRRGYFYRNGLDGDKFKASVLVALKQHGFTAEAIDWGDHWAPFKGGASLAQSSHFYVVIR